MLFAKGGGGMKYSNKANSAIGNMAAIISVAIAMLPIADCSW